MQIEWNFSHYHSLRDTGWLQYYLKYQCGSFANRLNKAFVGRNQEVEQIEDYVRARMAIQYKN